MAIAGTRISRWYVDITNCFPSKSFIYIKRVFLYIHKHIDPQAKCAMCMDDRLTPFYAKNREFNANIKHNPIMPFENGFIPYVGNGVFGIEIQESANLYIKYGRYLSLPVFFHPIVSVAQKNTFSKEATVSDYLNGIVYRFDEYHLVDNVVYLV